MPQVAQGDPADGRGIDNGRAPHGQPASSEIQDVDIAIIGGGLSGSTAAVVLGRAGYKVVVIDNHAIYPNLFKAEKLEPDQIALLQKMDLMDCLLPFAVGIAEVTNGRNGRVIDRTRVGQYGILYHDMVNAVRARIPAVVDLRIGRVADVEVGPERQHLALADGHRIRARLVILASGVGSALRQKLGIGRRLLRESHSVACGFTVSPEPGRKIDFGALTYYGERVTDRIDYLSLFPVSEGLRANLFTYREAHDPWLRLLAQEPRRELRALMPGLAHFLGNFTVPGRVQLRPIGLERAENFVRPGVVLVGDVFQVSCPATGTGVSKLLTDVDVLCNAHLPRWLDTPGMGAEKIARFYEDPRKQACDSRALHWAEYRRAVSTETGLAWELHRRRVHLHRRMRDLFDRTLRRAA
ncbi:MAG: FAD-dependent monooxygenase [Alphaproteobacteria bacterium]|nr:FAD-dependent monooxygenase [Alphaproteobacteria bacterium]